MEYPDKESAEAACLLLEGHILDKNHTFSAYLFTDLRCNLEPTKNWEPPTKRDYVDVVSLSTFFVYKKLKFPILGRFVELASKPKMHRSVCDSSGERSRFDHGNLL